MNGSGGCGLGDGGSCFVLHPAAEAETCGNKSGEHELGTDEHPKADAPCGTEAGAQHQPQPQHGENQKAGLKRSAQQPVEEGVGIHGSDYFLSFFSA